MDGGSIGSISDDFNNSLHTDSILESQSESLSNSNHTFASPSQNLPNPESGLSTVHSSRSLQSYGAGIRRFISWLYRSSFARGRFNNLNIDIIPSNANPNANEQDDQFEQSILSNFEEEKAEVLYAEDLSASMRNNFRRPNIQVIDAPDLPVPNEDILTTIIVSHLEQLVVIGAAQVQDIQLQESSIQSDNSSSASIVNNLQQSGIQVLYVENLPVDNDIPAAFDLLPMSRKDLQRRLKYWTSQREMIEIRRTALEEWFSLIEWRIRETRDLCKHLLVVIQKKNEEIKRHCSIRKGQWTDIIARYKADYHDSREGSLRNSLRCSEGSQAQEMMNDSIPDVKSNIGSFSVYVMEVSDMNQDLLIDLAPNSNEKLDIFPNRYNERLKRLKEGIEKLEHKIKDQDKKTQKEKENILKEYKERCTRSGINSLYASEICFMREVRKQYENIESFKRALSEFIKEIREFEQANLRVLDLGDTLEEVYIKGEELERIKPWQEFQIVNNEKPLVLIEKSGYFWSKGTLGKMGPLRLALTSDRFLMVYKVNAESREPIIYAQFKVAEIMGKKDQEGSLVLHGEEVKKRTLWRAKRLEFKIEFLCYFDMKQFLECYKKSYEKSFLKEEILDRNRR